MTTRIVLTMLGVAQELAPSSVEQEAFANIVREMQAAGETDQRILITLCQSLTDGLRYKNWPGSNKARLALDSTRKEWDYNIIGAIKKYREMTGCNLKEAHEAIKAEAAKR